MFKKIFGLMAVFFTLMFLVTFIQVKSEEPIVSKELEDKVIVYTTYDKDITDMIENEFEKVSSIDVEITKFSSDSSLVSAIEQQKGAAPDVIFGLSKDSLENLQKKGLLESNITSWSNDIGQQNKDSKGYWYGVFESPIVMFYNKSMIRPENIPQNFMALGDKRYSGLIAMPSTDTLAFKYFLNTVVSPYIEGNKIDEAFKLLAPLKFNIKEYKNKDDEVVSAVSKRECAIGFADIRNVQKSIKDGSDLAVIYGSEKYPIMINGIAVVKDCKNINSARLFEEFAVGPKVQYEIADKFSLIPTNDKASVLADNLGDLKGKMYEVNTVQFNNNINSWSKKWNDIVKEQTPIQVKNYIRR